MAPAQPTPAEELADLETQERDLFGDGADPAAANQQPGGDENIDDFFNAWWTGEMPVAVGKIASSVHQRTQDRKTQRVNTLAIFNLMEADVNMPLAAINAHTRVHPFIINIPDSSKVKVIYGLEIGFVDDVNFDEIKEIHAMCGEMNPLTRHPTGVLLLPSDIFKKKTLTVPSDTWLASKVARFDSEKWPQFKIGSQQSIPDVHRKDVEIRSVAPVPPFTIMDGFENDDIDAHILFARLNSLDAVDRDPAIQHALNFLKATMVKYRTDAAKAYHPNQRFWTTAPSPVQVAWAQEKCRRILPDALPPVPPPAVAAQNNGLTADAIQQIIAAAIGAATMSTAVANNANTVSPTSEGETEWEKKLGMSARGIENQLHFCGYKKDESPEVLPEYLSKMAKKQVTKAEKDGIILDMIQKFRPFDDVTVQLIPPIATTLRDRNYAGTAVQEVTYHNCTKGLSLFLMREIGDSDLTDWQESDDALTKASHTTKSDHLENAPKPSIPKDWRELIEHLKKFINIVYPLSENNCPLGTDAKQIIKLINGWSPTAKAHLCREQIASIMWTFVEQTRYFLLDPKATMIPQCQKFSMMVQFLTCEQAYINRSVPAKLLTHSTGGATSEKSGGTKRKTSPTSLPDENKGKAKPKPTQQNWEPVQVNMHPRIKTAVGPLLEKAMAEGKKLTDCLRAANLGKPSNLVPDGICANGAVYGRCKNKYCTREHKQLTDEILVDKLIHGLEILKEFPDRLFTQQGQ